MEKVLVVEDHPDMRELLIWQLELMGFLAIPARHGKEGVEKALQEKPDLILQAARFFLSAVKGTTSGFTSALKSLYLSLTVCW